MEAGTIWYAPISFSQVKGYGGYILVKEHNSGANRSSSPPLVDSVSSPQCWCTRASITINISIATFTRIYGSRWVD